MLFGIFVKDSQNQIQTIYCQHTSNRCAFDASQTRFRVGLQNSGKIYILSHLTKYKIVPLVLLNMICI